MMKKLYSAILLLLLLTVQAYGAATPQTGFYVRANCNQITAPANNQTVCLQSTTASGRTAGIVYVWSASAWNPIIATGGTGCNSTGASILYGDGAGGCSNVTVGSGLSFVAPNLTASGGSGGLTLVEHKTVTSNSTTQTFSGLDGNSDGTYSLSCRIVNNSGGSAAVYTWQPNAVTSNQASRHNAAGGSNTDTSNLQLGIGNSNGNWASFTATIFAKANPHSIGFARTYTGQVTYFTSSPAVGIGTTGGGWNETSTNITSIVVVSDQANGIGDGSECWLYKYAQ